MSENKTITILRNLIQPIAESHGVELVDIEYTGSARGQLVRVFVDTETGIRMEQCERISRDIADILDQKDVIPSRYRLEVSSPGLDRPLKNARDFQRQLGRKVKISYSEHEDKIKTITGIIEKVDETSMLVQLEKEQINIALVKILLAKIVPVW